MKTGRDCCKLHLKSPEDGEEEIQVAAQEACVDAPVMAALSGLERIFTSTEEQRTELKSFSVKKNCFHVTSD